MSISAKDTRNLITEVFVPRSDDIYIVSYPRSGTTWLQMILYQLTTSGDMNFTHISQYIPFLDRARLRGRNLENLPSPRIFKTHLQLRRVMSWPGKYIYVAREGKDVLISYYNFYRDYLDFCGSFEEFFVLFLRGTVQYGSWFNHVKDARTHLGENNVLFLDYEDLVTDFDNILNVITQFLGCDISEEKRASVISHCSFEFMRQHESKFDHATELLWEKTQELSAGSFIRKGEVGGWRAQLTSAQERAFIDASMQAGLSNDREK